MPNFREGSATAADGLYLFITSEAESSGVIEYFDANEGAVQTLPFATQDNSAIIKLERDGVELRSLNDGERIHTDPAEYDSDQITAKSVHVSLDDGAPPIRLYALHYMQNSSDGWAVIPTDALGDDYVVAAYPSNGKRKPASPINELDLSSAPSQMAIVATDDETTVDIVLSTQRSWGSNRKSRQIVLQRGQVYFIQANLGVPANLRDDLTGTLVSSDKPVAVFAGNKVTSVPGVDVDEALRSYLAEQMPPINAWGFKAVLVPFRPAVGDTIDGADEYRIIIGDDSTTVSVDGIVVGEFQKGMWFDGALTEAHVVEADGRFLAVQYKKSTNAANDRSRAANPLMMIAPSAEQFTSRHDWYNVDIESSPGSPIYSDQYAIIVATTASFSTIELDGVALTETPLEIGTSGYAYVTATIDGGRHSLTSATTAGVYVYGYGAAHAYGFPAGMNLITIDTATDSGPEPKPDPDTLTTYISMSDAFARPGEEFTIAVILDSLSQLGIETASTIATFEVGIRFNATLFTPLQPDLRGTINGGGHTTRLAGRYTGQLPGQALVALDCIAGLGDAETSLIEILDFHWFSDAGDTIVSFYELRRGRFQLEGIWEDTDGKRLINPNPGALTLSLSPNPAGVQTMVSVAGPWPELGGSLELFDAEARLARDLTDELLDLPGAGTITLPLDGLNAGAYYCRLTAGQFILVRSLIVE